ncbi:MAG: amino acid adenylation domain-containing protein, partial [bacterium]|nr:amino acid adenylation domain-containing protein [bacterium]
MIINKFEEAAAKFSKSIAVETAESILTYDELNKYANRVARQLPGKGKQQMAALLLGHDEGMIAAVLGALKAGKVYVPLDIAYPEKRLLYILENSEARVILTDNKNLGLAEKLVEQVTGGKQGLKVVNIDTLDNEDDGNLSRAPSTDRPAYILYTSGSTGNPKGVIQDHGNVLYYIRNWTSRFGISPSDRLTLFSAFTHDGAGQDMFGALLNGAALYPRNIKDDEDALELASWVIHKKITLWHSVPTLFRHFINTLTLNPGLNPAGKNNPFPDLRFILLGGEPLRKYDLEMYKQFFPTSAFANVYGQTESSVNSIWVIQPGDHQSLNANNILIGKPLDETELLIIDSEGSVVDEFGVGEIFVASPHIAPGYWKDGESSQKVFLEDPNLGRLYRTGDLGRLISDGCIEIMGRKDFQIKIRGFRVELGEIETSLLRHQDIKEAVVVTHEKEMEILLYAYIVTQDPVEIAEPELRGYLSGQLPDYMIPSRFMQLESMPLTPSNK